MPKFGRRAGLDLRESWRFLTNSLRDRAIVADQLRHGESCESFHQGGGYDCYGPATDCRNLTRSSLFRGPWPGFPHLHCPVIPAAGNTFPVRAETHAHDGISVSFEGELLSAGFRIP